MKCACSTCGRPVPPTHLDGLCPSCLIGSIGLDASLADGTEAGEDGGRRSVGEGAEGWGSRHGWDVVVGHTVLGELGRGGMGIVYRARQHAPVREVALKMLLASAAGSVEQRERFRLEASTLSRLDHVGILPVFATGEADGFPWFTMKLATGGNLAERVPTLRGQWRAVAELIGHLADALQYAHEHGVLHRDLKPGNVLFDEHGRAYLADFGLAKIADADSNLTRADGLLGTPNYLAPEIALADARAATTASDVYGLGAILHELITGAPPHRAESRGALLRSVAEELPGLASDSATAVPRDLRVICLKCLARQPRDRYASAREVAEDLRRFGRGEPIQARPLGRWEALERWARRKPGLAASLAVIAVLLAGITLTSVLSARRIAGLRREALVLLYASDMRLAQQAVAENKLDAALELLDRHQPRPGEPDLRSFEWHHLRALSQSDEAATLGSHGQQADRIAFSPDGRWLASASSGLYLWNVSERRLVRQIPLSNYVFAMAFSPDSRLIALTLTRGGWEIYDVESGARRLARPETNGAVKALCWSTNGESLALLQPGQLASWEVRSNVYVTGREVPRDIHRADLAENARSAIVTRAGPNRVTGYDLASGRELFSMEETIRAVAASRDGAVFAAGGYSGQLWLMRRDQARLQSVPAHRGLIQAMQLSSDGRLLATGGADRVIRIWEVAVPSTRRTLRGHRSVVQAVAFSPDQQWLASCDRSGEVKLWDLREARVRPELAGSGIFSVLAQDGSSLTTLESGGQVVVRRGSDVVTKPGRWGEDELTNAVLVLPDRGALWRFDAGWTVRAVGPAGDGLLDGLPPLSRGAGILMAPDERWVVVSPRATHLPAVWSLGAREFRLQVTKGFGQWTSAAISADSRRFAFGGPDGAMRILDVKSGRELPPVAAHRGFAYAADFSRDGRRLVTAGFDGRVKYWDLESRELLGEFRSTADSYWTVALSPDERRIAAGTMESSVVVWDVASGNVVAVLDLGEPLRPVEGCLRFSPDGRALIYSGGGDWRIWR